MNIQNIQIFQILIQQILYKLNLINYFNSSAALRLTSLTDNFFSSSSNTIYLSDCLSYSNIVPSKLLYISFLNFVKLSYYCHMFFNF